MFYQDETDSISLIHLDMSLGESENRVGEEDEVPHLHWDYDPY